MRELENNNTASDIVVKKEKNKKKVHERSSAVKHRKRKERDSSQQLDENQSNSDKGDFNEPELEGVVHDCNLYLVDKAKKKVYHSIRDNHGALLSAGYIDSQGLIKITDLKGLDSVGDLVDDHLQIHDEKNLWQQKSLQESLNMKNKKGKKKKEKKPNVVDHETAQAQHRHLSENHEHVPHFVYPFDTQQDDHCETPFLAYQHIAPLLEALAKALNVTKDKLRIYDPFYCQGLVVENLHRLGFHQVHNKLQDFYQVVKNNEVPVHDILVTNPPYSEFHIEKIIDFCVYQNHDRPWALLLPNFVYLKDYYQEKLCAPRASSYENLNLLGKRPRQPFYITPSKRYLYESPKNVRLNVKSAQRKTSPFVSFWYVHLGKIADNMEIFSNIFHHYQNSNGDNPYADLIQGCKIAFTPAQLDYKMMDSNDARRKKERNRKRSLERMRKFKKTA